MNQHENDYISRSRSINDFCLNYGCFFETAWMRGFESNRIEAYVTDSIRATEPRDLVYSTINEWFNAVSYHPFTRAHFIYRAQQTPKICEISHQLERGLINYYKGDFLSAASVLIPSVEGLLRYYLNGAKDIGMRLVDQIDTLNVVIPHTHFHGRRAMYIDFLSRWLRNWFFSHTSAPQLGTIPSNLNRNSSLHSFDSRSFYRPSDCNRLFSFFDIALEVLTIEEPSAARFLSHPSPDIPEVNAREEYYASLILPWSPWRALHKTEEDRFMADNPRYERSDVPDWAGLIAALQEELNGELKGLVAGEAIEVNPLPPKPIPRDSPLP